MHFGASVGICSWWLACEDSVIIDALLVLVHSLIGTM